MESSPDKFRNTIKGVRLQTEFYFEIIRYKYSNVTNICNEYNYSL